jgi:hypothetical protein
MRYLQIFSAIAVAVIAASEACPAFGQSATNEIIRGPFFSGTIRGPKSNEAIAMRGIVVTVGEQKRAFVCYDMDLMRVSMAWTGDFLEFGNTQTQIAWPPPPQVKGSPVFSTKAAPGWGKDESLADPRPKHQGPLPKDWAHYRGLYVSGNNVVFSYTVGADSVLEMPGYESGAFTRSINLPASKQSTAIALCSFDADPDAPLANRTVSAGSARYVIVGKTRRLAVGIVGAPNDAKFASDSDQLHLEVPKHGNAARIKIAIRVIDAEGDVAAFENYLKEARPAEDLTALCKGGAAHWTENITTKGTRSADNDAYVVDTIAEPLNNPYNAQVYFGGFDFLSDGRAVVCAFHGDVWVVSGIDDTLEKLTWKRFATGLFQPLGVKVVRDTVYVLGRDQITILRDLNKDGEADYYENFNNDTVVTANYHEFCLDLHTDRAGNFYFAKGAPWEPEVTSPHQGCLFKIPKDGSKLEIIATGLRAPNGMTVGPRDEITVSDNQGHWMPSSKLDWIEKGGFYGMTPAAHRELVLRRDGTNFTANPSEPEDRARYKFKAWGDANAPQPEGYDRPICWLPQSSDNSSGGQVWVTSKKWGPLEDRLLFMSYGKCTLFEVMLNEANGVRQAAMAQFPLKFYSGIMRGRFNQKDGQLYLCGLRGWQTAATRNGGFYRVRYTGQPVRMPTGFVANKSGAEITFATPVNVKSAADAANYSCERWNYRWTGAYGSPEFSVDNPDQKKHDKLEVKSAKVSADGKKVTLEIENMKPADQIKIKYSLEGDGGAPVSQEIFATAYILK